MDEFILRALTGGLLVALLCGPLGCLVVWQKMAYFGAALSHTALLGIALGLLLDINLYLAIVVVCVGASLALMAMDRNREIASDTALGVLAHGTLALGIIIVSTIPGIRVDLMGYLFGDILAVTWQDIMWIATVVVIGGCVLVRTWQPLLMLVIHRELALADGTNEARVRMVFLVLLSLVVAVSMQVVGILLVVSLLIIPAATARQFARSPEQMALGASLIGALSVLLGILLSLTLDTPAGPSVVVIASAIYLLVQVYGWRTCG